MPLWARAIGFLGYASVWAESLRIRLNLWASGKTIEVALSLEVRRDVDVPECRCS